MLDIILYCKIVDLKVFYFDLQFWNNYFGSAANSYSRVSEIRLGFTQNGIKETVQHMLENWCDIDDTTVSLKQISMT